MIRSFVGLMFAALAVGGFLGDRNGRVAVREREVDGGGRMTMCVGCKRAVDRRHFTPLPGWRGPPIWFILIDPDRLRKPGFLLAHSV